MLLSTVYWFPFLSLSFILTSVQCTLLTFVVWPNFVQTASVCTSKRSDSFIAFLLVILNCTYTVRRTIEKEKLTFRLQNYCNKYCSNYPNNHPPTLFLLFPLFIFFRFISVKAVFASCIPEIIELVGVRSKYEGALRNRPGRRWLLTCFVCYTGHFLLF